MTLANSSRRHQRQDTAVQGSPHRVLCSLHTQQQRIINLITLAACNYTNLLISLETGAFLAAAVWVASGVATSSSGGQEFRMTYA